MNIKLYRLAFCEPYAVFVDILLMIADCHAGGMPMSHR